MSYSKILTIALMVALTACTGAKRQKTEKLKSNGDGFPVSSKELSAWVRSNSDHYWAFMKGRTEVAAYLGPQGILAGDPHIANFNPTPILDRDGNWSMQYLYDDFDDGGHGPLVLDIVRLLTITKATKEKAKSEPIIDAYIAGLMGETLEQPAELAKYMAISRGDYRALTDKQIAKRATAQNLKIKAGVVEVYDGPITKDMIAPFLPGHRILDIARRVHLHGSSRDLIRLFVLTVDTSDVQHLYELKQWSQTALSLYQDQPAPTTWFQELRSVFWTGLDPVTDQFIEISGQGHFFLREKKSKLIDVPYGSEDKQAIKWVQRFAAYAASTLGRAHGAQTSGHDLAARLQTDSARAEFRSAVKQAARVYLQTAYSIAAKDKNVSYPEDD